MSVFRLEIIGFIVTGFVGCSVEVPAPDDGVFLCDNNDHCAEGYKCGPAGRCITTDSPDIIGYDEGISLIANAYCTLVLGCCDDGFQSPTGPISTQSACVTEMKQMMGGSSSNPETNDRVIYDPALATECMQQFLEAIAQSTCNMVDPMNGNGPDFPACQQMTKGKQQQGQDCKGGDECADNLACDCQWVGSQPVCTICRPTVGQNGDCTVDWCEEGLYCDSTSHCQARKSAGTTCDNDGECINDFCDHSSSPPKCGAANKINDSCMSPLTTVSYSEMVEILAGSYCAALFRGCPDGIHLMGSLSAANENECITVFSGFLEDQFGGDPANNDNTEYDGEAAAECLNALQQSLQGVSSAEHTDPLWGGPQFPGCDTMINGMLGNGEECWTDYECSTGFRCKRGCSGCVGACGPVGTGTCGDDRDCVDGYYCETGNCQVRRDNNSACDEDSKCKSHYCSPDGACKDPIIGLSCDNGAACFNETFYSNRINDVKTETVCECFSSSDCTDAGTVCVFDPRRPGNATCRPTCDVSNPGECTGQGLECAYGQDIDGTACLRPAQWRGALDGYIPAWAAKNGCTAPGCSIDTTMLESEILSLNPNDYVSNIELVGRTVILEASDATNHRHVVIPVDGNGNTCPQVSFQYDGTRRGMATIRTAGGGILIGTTCYAEAGGWCGTGTAASIEYFQVYDVVRDSQGCGTNFIAVGNPVMLPGWGEYSMRDLTGGNGFFAISGVVTIATSTDEIHIISGSAFGSRNQVNLSTTDAYVHGWLAAAGNQLHYSRQVTAGGTPHAELVTVDYQTPNTLAYSVETDNGGSICEIVAVKDRLLWTRDYSGYGMCGKSDNVTINYAEGGYLGGDLPDNREYLTTISPGDGTPTGSSMTNMVALSGSVVAWVEQDSNTFAIKAIDLTNRDLDPDNDGNPSTNNEIVIAWRSGSTSDYCYTGAPQGTHWRVDGFALDSSERGLLTLVYVATCSDYTSMPTAKRVFSRTFFGG